MPPTIRSRSSRPVTVSDIRFRKRACASSVVRCICFLGLFLVVGRVTAMAELRDLSAEPRYRAVIGREYELQGEFTVYGVRLNLRSPNPDYYQMVPSAGPGVGGPEIIPFGRLSAGTRITVAAVGRAPWSLKPVYVVIPQDPDDNRFAMRRIRINAARAFGLYQIGGDKRGAPLLTSRWFREVSPGALPGVSP
jgi:hypothetical protein